MSSRLLAVLSVGFIVCSLILGSCAKMGQPDGGWYDERPPEVIGATPADKAINVKSRNIVINFNEYRVMQLFFFRKHS